MSKTNPLKRAFDLYMSDLNYNEIERLIKKDAAEVYEFFSSDIPKPDKKHNKFTRALIFARSLFNAFLLKLKPARRMFYIAALLIFIVGYIQGIGSYVITGFIILNGLLAFELADKLLTKDELQLARKIQSGLMPKTPPNNKFYEITAFYQSAKEVGGDYFDIIKTDLGDEKTYVIVGDISGKGIAAALYMVKVQSIIRMLSSSTSSMKEILIQLKKYFSENLQKDYFLTLIGASIENEGSLKVCSAGHNPFLYFNSASNSFKMINPKGIGIGLKDNGLFEKTLEEEVIKPSTNDIIIFYTDGLTEAMNERKTQFGIERLQTLIKNNKDKTAVELKELIIREIKNFIGNDYQHDDLTFIILKAKD